MFTQNYRAYDRSLVTKDINGAQSKPLHFYMDRHLPQHYISNANQEQLMQEEQSLLASPKRLNYSQEHMNYGRRQYQRDFHKASNQIVPQGELFFNRGGKRHYEVDEGEIRSFKALQNDHDIPKPMSDEIDRTLQTKDIEGAVPGTLISKVVKNKDKALYLKQMQLEEKQQKLCNLIKNPIILKEQQEQAYKEYLQQCQQPELPYNYRNNQPHQKMHSINSDTQQEITTYTPQVHHKEYQKLNNNQSMYIDNNPYPVQQQEKGVQYQYSDIQQSKLSNYGKQIMDMQSLNKELKINPIGNYFQERPIGRNYIKDDYVKTKQILGIKDYRN